MNLAIGAILLPLVAAAVPIWVVGTARALDGDTLEIAGEEVRLLGMDAPESDQVCLRDDKPWRCGDVAAAALRGLVADRNIRCEITGRERSGRGLAVCKVGDVDLAREMVRQGMAVTYYPEPDASPQMGPSYAREELAAEAAQRGLWSGAFVWPEDWREGIREGFVDPISIEPRPMEVLSPTK